MRFHVLMLYGIACLMAACAQRPANTPTPLPDPHHHVVDANNNALGQQNAAEFKMVAVSVGSNLQQENITTNQIKTFRAFSTCDQMCRMFVEELSTGPLYELHTPSFSPGRQFSDLVWVANDILVFDQWTQPNHGVHYSVDVRGRKLLLASPVPSQAP